jgi:glutamate synthase (NADPH/NADH) small chain
MSKEFLTTKRISDVYRPVHQRKKDFQEVERKLTAEEIHQQSARCMTCGIPFCHGMGCPLCNVIPEINEAVHKGRDREAYELLSSTSPLPEFTSRVCPALCEGSCTASLGNDSVMIRQIEKQVIETACEKGWVTCGTPKQRTGKSVAVIGSGPAGLTAAIEMNKAGHRVSLYERQPDFGGLLRYGIPAFKLEKSVIDRRIQLMREAGIELQADTEIGKDISLEYLSRQFDAVLVATGTPSPRPLEIPGAELNGIYYALYFLNGYVSAEGKNVLIIGGGDTGSDCVGLSVRQGAKSILQIEIMPEPPEGRSASTPWPLWPYKQRTSSSQMEGGTRRYNLQSTRCLGTNGAVSGVEVQSVDWALSEEGRPLSFKPVEGTTEVLKADLVFLAMGFLKPSFENKGDNLFVIGDAANGPSLVVRAMADAIKAVENINRFLLDNTSIN